MRLIKNGMGDYNTLCNKTTLETLDHMNHLINLQEYIDFKVQVGN